jgi:hypothetical protein
LVIGRTGALRTCAASAELKMVQASKFTGWGSPCAGAAAGTEVAAAARTKRQTQSSAGIIRCWLRREWACLRNLTAWKDMIPSFGGKFCESSSGAEALHRLHGTWRDVEQKANFRRGCARRATLGSVFDQRADQKLSATFRACYRNFSAGQMVGKPTRWMSVWNRGSERNGSRQGSTIMYVRPLSLTWYALSSHSKAWSLFFNPA